LVGDGKTEHAARELMAGINGEDVPADGFGLFGLVEITIEFDFGEASGMPALEMDLSGCSIEPPVSWPIGQT